MALKPARVSLAGEMEARRRQSAQFRLAAEVALAELLQMYLRRPHQQLVAEGRAELDACLAAERSAVQLSAHPRQAKDVGRVLPDDQRHAHSPQRLIEDRRSVEERVADHVLQLLAVVQALKADFPC